MAASGNKLGQELLALKDQLNEQLSERASLQGELKNAMKRLKEEFGVDTLEEAKAQLQELDERIETLQSSIIKNLAKAQEALDGKGSDEEEEEE